MFHNVGYRLGLGELKEEMDVIRNTADDQNWTLAIVQHCS
jgi:hypothetical protein